MVRYRYVGSRGGRGSSSSSSGGSGSGSSSSKAVVCHALDRLLHFPMAATISIMDRANRI